MSDTPSFQHLTLTAMVIYATVFAFFISPLLRYSDPVYGVAAGLGLAAGAGLGHLTWNHPETKMRLYLRMVAFALFVAGVTLSIGFVSDAMYASTENDVRCAKVQRIMQQPPKNVRSDIADVFSALGCRPQP